MPIDTVCGIELDKELATTFEHDDKTFSFVVKAVENCLKKNQKNT